MVVCVGVRVCGCGCGCCACVGCAMFHSPEHNSPQSLPFCPQPAIEVFFRPDVYSVKEGERVNITLVTNRIFAVDFDVTVTLREIPMSATGAVNSSDSNECLQ